MVLKDIHLYTDGELLNELMGRFDACVFAARRHITMGDSFVMRRYVGDKMMCRGLCATIDTLIADDIEETMQVIDDKPNDAKTGTGA